jgi:hypothetical protein
MSSYNVARTATGYSHGNTIVVLVSRTVPVFLDIPHLPSDLTDQFRLVSQDGQYDRTLSRSEAVDKDDQRVALYFTEVPAGGTYSLYHGATPDCETLVFIDIPFADLPSSGEDAGSASWTEIDKLALSAPPQLELDDALLNGHTDDYALDDAAYLDLVAYRCQEPDDSSELA